MKTESEAKAIDMFREFVATNRADLQHVASWGDGRCGYLLDMLRRELQPGFDQVLSARRERKQPPRVSRHLRVDRRYIGARWVRFSNPESGMLPTLPCCYVVFHSDEVIYVGQTTNLRARMRTHRIEKSFPIGFEIKVRFGERYGDWLMREARLIKRLQPRQNRKIA